MKTTVNSKSRSSIRTTILATVSFSLLAGILAAVWDVAYGWTLFALTPFLAGCVAGLLTPSPRTGQLALVSAGIVCAMLLVITGLEGFVCITMALPLIWFWGVCGLFLGIIIRRIGRFGTRPGGPTATVLLGALLVACSAFAEQEYRQQHAYESVVTSRVFPKSVDHVWEEILEFRQIEGKKPILLKLGLPVPLRCVMEQKGIGAHRICYFDHGTIEQQVTVWKPPVKLELQIIDVTLPGKDWLQIKSATYDLEALDAGETIVHRTTRYNSVLRPRIYWRPLEQFTIHSEHQYVFNALASKLENSVSQRAAPESSLP